jgi:hypothetical protein
MTNNAEVSLGDLVDCGKYGKGYVCNTNAGGRMVKLTDKEQDRTNQFAKGWFVNEEDVYQVLEKYHAVQS